MQLVKVSNNQCITAVFGYLGILDITKQSVGLNMDGTSVNMGIHSVGGALSNSDSLWLQLMYWFNHRLKRGIKTVTQHLKKLTLCLVN